MSDSGSWEQGFPDSEQFGSGYGGDFHIPDEEDDLIREAEEATRDIVIYMVDCNASMRQPMPGKINEGKSYLATVFEALSNALKSKVVSNATDLVCILLFGTVQHENPSDFKHIYVMQKPDQPDAKLIKRLDALAREPELFEREFGGSVKDGEYDLSLAFWTCKLLLQDNAMKKLSKRIIVFSNTEDPSFGDHGLRNKINTQIQDTEGLDLSLHLIPFQRIDTPSFSALTFWADAIKLDADEAIQIVERGTRDLEELQDRLRRKEFKKRTLGTLPFIISGDVAFNVKMYCMYRTATKDYGKFLDAKTNDPLTSKTVYMSSLTGEDVDPKDFKTYYPYSDVKVSVTKDEVKQLKTFGPPGVTLMGFKPLSTLKDFHNVRSSYFIYPDETTVKGSTLAFASLLEAMNKHKRVAIARWIPRKNAELRFVALVPQMETFNKDGTQAKPPGMHAIFLPYHDDIRKPKIEEAPKADPSLIAKAKVVVQTCQVKFNNQTFENPSLQQHYAIIQAIALEEEAPETVVDTTQPDYDFFTKPKVKAALEAFREAVGVEGVAEEEDDEEGAGAGAKRKRPSTSAGPAKKKAKKEVPADDSGINWKKEAESGKLNKLTMDKLKIYLRSNGLRLSGKKDELVQRVYDHVMGAA